MLRAGESKREKWLFFSSLEKLNDHHLSNRHNFKVWLFKTYKGIIKAQAPFTRFSPKFNFGPNVQKCYFHCFWLLFRQFERTNHTPNWQKLGVEVKVIITIAEKPCSSTLLFRNHGLKWILITTFGQQNLYHWDPQFSCNTKHNLKLWLWFSLCLLSPGVSRSCGWGGSFLTRSQTTSAQWIGLEAKISTSLPNKLLMLHKRLGCFIPPKIWESALQEWY